MKSYDPFSPPDPGDWQSLDELERIILVLEYHRGAGGEQPNEQAHATIHAVVENQIALLDETPVRATLERLIGEGLDRHDAIHAIGSVLANFLQEVLADDKPVPGVYERYYEELDKLSADNWLREFI
ncbi:MAG: hypothetical protein QF393_15655 [Rhodospirillales bacterium]|nr:hypothetical protein [Rhodospirillales bacterium]MDP6645847.1 hypothetical protein [Rhodospirillales bacterium]